MRHVPVVGLLILSFPACAQDTSDVTLRFVDCLSGEPVRGTAVRMHNAVIGFPPHPPEGTEYQEFSATTSDEGSVVFHDVPDGRWEIALDSLEGRHVVTLDSIISVNASGPAAREVRTVLDGSIRVAVRYADTDEPVPGAVVCINPRRWEMPNPPPWRGADPHYGPGRGTPTNTAGLLQLRVRPGPYAVWVEPAGLPAGEPAQVTVEPDTLCEVPTFRVERLDCLPRAIGRVRDRYGNGIEGALVSVRKVNPYRLENPAFTWCAVYDDPIHGCRTTEGGFYDIPDLRYYRTKIGGVSVAGGEGAVGIAVVAERCAINWADIAEPETGDLPMVLDFVMELPRTVRVDFTNAGSGQRISGPDWAVDLYWPGRSRGEGPLRWLLEEDEEGAVLMRQVPSGECRWELLRVAERDARRRSPTRWEKVADGYVTIPAADTRQAPYVEIRAEVHVGERE